MKEKKFDRKALLMEAALEEFSINDFERASLNNIIKSAGISKGVFYYHFENKEALYLALLKSGIEAKWAYIIEYTKLHQADFDQLDIFDQFLHQAELGIGFANRYPKFHMLSNMFIKERNNPIYLTAMEYLGKSSTDVLTPMIKVAMERNEFKPHFDEEFIVKLLRHLFAEFEAIFYQEGFRDQELMMTNLKKYVDFIRYGLKK